MNNKLNCCAYNITRPDRRKNRGWINRGATETLDANRKGIETLRQRGFSWGQIHRVLERMGVDIELNNLYQWKLSRFDKR
jgi:hypothetical protein